MAYIGRGVLSTRTPKVGGALGREAFDQVVARGAVARVIPGRRSSLRLLPRRRAPWLFLENPGLDCLFKLHVLHCLKTQPIREASNSSRVAPGMPMSPVAVPTHKSPTGDRASARTTPCGLEIGLRRLIRLNRRTLKRASPASVPIQRNALWVEQLRSPRLKGARLRTSGSRSSIHLWSLPAEAQPNVCQEFRRRLGRRPRR
jgi:hypothetical protein